MWKDNWDCSKQHFVDWWNHTGFVLGMWGNGFIADIPLRAAYPEPAPTDDLEQYHTDLEYRSSYLLHDISRRCFPADTLPIVRPSDGTVELAAYLGALPNFREDTIWYQSIIKEIDTCPSIEFDPKNKWFARMEALLKRLKDSAGDDFIVGLPGISPNLDVLAELRGTAELMMDMMERPAWVKHKTEEIDSVYFEVYQRFYDIVCMSDGSSVFYPFMLWAPGRVSQLQCDTAAMISPAMFREFVLPGLDRVTRWLDYSLFHVDGPDMVKHVDLLLELDDLNAIQFTPGPGVPRGGHSHWHEMYKRILQAGKSVQAVWLNPEDVLPLLDSIGSEGVYLMVECQGPDQMEQLYRETESYR